MKRRSSAISCVFFLLHVFIVSLSFASGYDNTPQDNTASESGEKKTDQVPQQTLSNEVEHIFPQNVEIGTTFLVFPSLQYPVEVVEIKPPSSAPAWYDRDVETYVEEGREETPHVVLPSLDNFSFDEDFVPQNELPPSSAPAWYEVRSRDVATSTENLVPPTSGPSENVQAKETTTNFEENFLLPDNTVSQKK